jgi:DNA repair protein RadC
MKYQQIKRIEEAILETDIMELRTSINKTMKEYKSTIDEFRLKKIKSDIPKAKITNSSDSAGYIRKFYSDDISIYESFFLLLLNRANSTIGYAKISQGGTVGTVVDVKLIAKYSIDGLACNIIIAHNHPSGNEKPSQADIDITRKIKNAMLLIDVTLLDHIILTEDSFYSMADSGDLF